MSFSFCVWRAALVESGTALGLVEELELNAAILLAALPRGVVGDGLGLAVGLGHEGGGALARASCTTPSRRRMERGY
jgi:hypothetical protein